MGVRITWRRAGVIAATAGVAAYAATLGASGVSAVTTSTFKFNPGLPLLDNNGASTGAAEPTIKVDSFGHIYVTGPAGVPTGGCPWWRVHPDSLNSQGKPYDYLGLFDQFPAEALGGGDCDIATGGLPPQNGYDNLALSSLSLANVTVNQSSDGGNTLHPTPNPVGTPGSWGDDRQWNADDTSIGQVYLAVHDVETDNIQVQTSDDGGYTYTPNTPAINFTSVPGAVTNNYFGEPVVDPHTHYIYIPFLAGATAQDSQNSVIDTVYIAVGNPCAVSCVAGQPEGPISWTDYTVYGPTVGASYGYIFPSAAIDQGGNVYVSWSDDSHVYISHSTTPASGGPWSKPVRMDKGIGATAHSNLMQWIVGGAAGVVDAVWYSADLTGSGTTCPTGATGTPNDSNGVNNNCFDSWSVEFAQSRDYGTTFSHRDVAEPIHIGSLCTQGLNCSLNGGNRNLLDFFQVSLDPAGAANIAYATDLTGTVNIDYTRQCAGESATTTAQISYSCKAFLPAPKPPAPICGNSGSGYQATVATDPTGDAINPTGAPGDTSAADITNVQFKTDGTNLTTTLTIANLAQDPPTPIAGTDDTYYYVAWETGGNWWATLASEPQPDSTAFSYGPFNTSTDQLTSATATTGTITTGSPGTISITVPLSAIGNPAIPVTKANAANAAVQNPLGVVISGEGAVGSGLVFTHPDDRAPNAGYGSNWSVC